MIIFASMFHDVFSLSLSLSLFLSVSLSLYENTRSTITGNSFMDARSNSSLKYRTNVYQGGLVRRLITVCNEFEWLPCARNPSLEKGVRYAR